MAKILDSSKQGQGNKLVETDKNFYLNNIEYTKDLSSSNPFKIYKNNGLINAFTTYTTLAPFTEGSYYNGFKENTWIRDNQNPNIIYVLKYKSRSYYGNNGYGSSGTNGYCYISRITNNEKIDNKYVYLSSNAGQTTQASVKFLGQDDDYLYIVHKSNYVYSSGYYVVYYDYATNSNIVKVWKKDPIWDNGSEDGELNRSYSDSIMYYKRSYGDFKIIKETEDKIIFLANKDGYQYSISYIDKTLHTVTELQSFYTETSIFSGGYSNGVIPTDPKMISDNIYQFYICGSNSSSYENIITKVTYDITEDIITKKQVTLDSPIFFGDDYNHYSKSPSNGGGYSRYYDKLFYIENENKKFLISMASCFAGSNTYNQQTTFYNFKDPESNLISMYEIIESPDGETITGTLLDTIKVKDFNGDFYGMLYNKISKSFFGMTENLAYFIGINFNTNKFSLYPSEIKPYQIGIDIDGNYWIMDNDTRIAVMSDTKVSDVITSIKEDVSTVPEIGDDPVPFTLQVIAKNYKGEQIPVSIKHTIVNPNSQFTETKQNVITKTTLIDDIQEIPFTLSRGCGEEIKLYSTIVYE